MTVCSVIVTYRPEPCVIVALGELLAQSERIHIIDNASEAGTVAMFRLFQSEHPDRVRLTCNPENLGLAAAQNQGIRQALEDGFDWILLLDDDSLPAPQMVAHLLAMGNDRSIGIVAPRIIDRNASAPPRFLMSGRLPLTFRRRSVREGERLSGVAFVIASGSMIRSAVLRCAGLMNEGFFIDYVDYEMCLRAQSLGFAVGVTGDALLYHRLGQKREHRAFGVAFTTNNHDSFRRYTIFRNRLFVLRGYGRRFPFVVVAETFAYGWDTLRILLYENNRWQKLRAAMRGLWHGLIWPLPKTTYL